MLCVPYINPCTFQCAVRRFLLKGGNSYQEKFGIQLLLIAKHTFIRLQELLRIPYAGWHQLKGRTTSRTLQYSDPSRYDTVSRHFFQRAVSSKTWRDRYLKYRMSKVKSIVNQMIPRNFNEIIISSKTSLPFHCSFIFFWVSYIKI